MGEDEVLGWLIGRVPAGWYEEAPEVTSDREEILVVGRIPDVKLAEGTSPEAANAARSGRIRQHREDTREERIRISVEAQRTFGKVVSWGARCGDAAELFTTLSVPVMTRLRIRERELLDALVDAGVARSRSHALAWCVRLVAQHQSEWLSELRATVNRLSELRAEGPKLN